MTTTPLPRLPDIGAHRHDRRTCIHGYVVNGCRCAFYPHSTNVDRNIVGMHPAHCTGNYLPGFGPLKNRLGIEYSEDPANCAIRVSPQTRRFMDTVYQRVFEPPSILSEHLQWQYSQLDNCWKTATGSIFQPDETFMKATTCTFTVTKTAYLSEIMVHHDRYHDLAEILKAMGAAEVHIPEYMDEKSLFDPDTIAANRRSCPGTGKVKISKADLSTINLKRYAKGQSWLDKLEEV